MADAAPPLSFRPPSPADVPAITALVRAAYARWVPLIGREPLPMTADYARAVQEHQFDLLCRGTALLGLIETMARPDHLWIENVAVAPAAQGGGLGRHLLARAEARAREAALGELRLLTNGAFLANIALYERLGYAVTAREPFRGSTTVHMRKQLGR